jgi:hypothetical protein
MCTRIAAWAVLEWEKNLSQSFIHDFLLSTLQNLARFGEHWIRMIGSPPHHFMQGEVEHMGLCRCVGKWKKRLDPAPPAKSTWSFQKARFNNIIWSQLALSLYLWQASQLLTFMQSNRKWEQLLKPFGVGAFQRWNRIHST